MQMLMIHIAGGQAIHTPGCARAHHHKHAARAEHRDTKLGGMQAWHRRATPMCASAPTRRCAMSTARQLQLSPPWPTPPAPLACLRSSSSSSSRRRASPAALHGNGNNSSAAHLITAAATMMLLMAASERAVATATATPCQRAAAAKAMATAPAAAACLVHTPACHCTLAGHQAAAGRVRRARSAAHLPRVLALLATATLRLPALRAIPLLPPPTPPPLPQMPAGMQCVAALQAQAQVVRATAAAGGHLHRHTLQPHLAAAKLAAKPGVVAAAVLQRTPSALPVVQQRR